MLRKGLTVICVIGYLVHTRWLVVSGGKAPLGRFLSPSVRDSCLTTPELKTPTAHLLCKLFNSQHIEKSALPCLKAELTQKAVSEVRQAEIPCLLNSDLWPFD